MNYPFDLKIETRKEFFLIFYVTFLFFFLELTFFSTARFVTYYYTAQLIIAIGLLSLALGGIIATLFKKDFLNSWISVFAITLPVTPWVGFLGALFLSLNFFVGSALVVLSFLPFGILIGVFYRQFEPFLLYTYELLGAVFGLITFLVLIPYLREENAITFSFLLTTLFISIFYRKKWDTPFKKILVSLSLTVAIFIFSSNFLYDYLNLVKILPCSKNSSFTLASKWSCQQSSPIKSVRSLGSVVDRIDIVSIPQSPFLKYFTLFSGELNDQILPYPSVPFYRFDARLPINLLVNPEVLIVGASVEGIGKVVKAIGAKEITAIDINPAIISIWEKDQEIGEYSHYPYSNTKLINADGRTFVEMSNQQFDIITLMNTHRSSRLATLGEPDFLHTKEAFKIFFQHLTPRGFFTVEEKGRDKDLLFDTAIEKISVTIATTLKDLGVEKPEKHIIVYKWIPIRPSGIQAMPATVKSPDIDDFIQFLVKRTPWTQSEINFLREWAKESSRMDNLVMPTNLVFDKWLWLPEGENKKNENSKYFFYSFFNSSSKELILTDNRPFPFNLVTVFKNPNYVYLYLYSATVFTVIFLISLGWWYVSNYRKISPVLSNDKFLLNKITTTKSTVAYLFLPALSTLIGLGYMSMQMALIQKFHLYLGSVPLSMAISIGGLLLFSAISSWKFKDNSIPTPTMIAVPFFVTGTYLFFIEIIWLFTFDSFFEKIIIALLISSIIGLGMGLYFPRAMTLVKKNFPGNEPLLAGLNGSAMAATVPLSIFASLEWGISSLVLIALLSYSFSSLLLILFSDNLSLPRNSNA
ncbi:MAG: hypothetical protein AAB513_00430 [Patescibacteria group bacterium]